MKSGLLIFISPLAFGHAGAHENQKCFITMDNRVLNLSGYQLQGQYPEHIYCRIFPELGHTLITVESLQDLANETKVTLKLLKFNNEFNWFNNFDNVFYLLKQTPLKKFNAGVNLIQVDIKAVGVYALQVELHSKNQIFYQRFLFLAGISVTKILVFFSVSVLLLLIIVLGRNVLIQSIK